MNKLMTKKQELTVNATKQIAKLETTIKTLQAQQKELKKQLLEVMQENNISKFENDVIRITKIDETYVESFDSKTFKQENQSVYDRYVKIKPKTAYVSIKVK